MRRRIKLSATSRSAKLKPIKDEYDAKLKLINDEYNAKRKPIDDEYYAKLEEAKKTVNNE